MHHEKCKDEFIKYWNENYHNLVMPIQEKHELKKIAWEFWKASYMLCNKS